MVFCILEIIINDNKKKLFRFKEAIYATKPIKKNDPI